MPHRGGRNVYTRPPAITWTTGAERIAIRRKMVKPSVPAGPEEIAALRSGFGIPEGARLVLCVARLSREKGHLDLVRPVAALRRRSHVPGFQLVIAGNGPERERIQRLCARVREVTFRHTPDAWRRGSVRVCQDLLASRPAASECGS